METVTMLLNARGEVVSVYADASDAEAKRDKFNADPFVEPGTADADAPYTTETWRVS